jgi:hypothetical protein
MLTRTILLPSVFRGNPEKSNAEYLIVIGFLLDLEKNGVVLVDDTECILAAIRKNINKWPPKYRPKAQKLLEKLEKKNRFIEMSLNDEVQAKCKNQQCQQCIRMAKIHRPPAIISSNHCQKCAEEEMTQFPSIEVVDIDEYSMSKFFEAHLNQNEHFSRKDELKPQEFEDKILKPLLRDAKHIKIYDRYIGRSILNEKSAKEYKFTIKWILDVFLRERGSKYKGIFEVYVGVNISKEIPKRKIRDATAALSVLEKEFQEMYPNFKLLIKDETKGSEMPHDRLLVTNQVAVLVGRGFNWLFGSSLSRLRDITISYCSDPGKIEQAVRELPDL